MKCIVDSSVWIDFFRGAKNKETLFLKFLITEGVDLAYNGIILTEVLQGFISEKDFTKAKTIFDSIIYLELNKKTYITAYEIYRQTRKKGMTIRSTVDCIIAASALENDCLLLEKDRDFKNISKLYKLKLAIKQ